MDPITVIASATASFETLKKGLAMGKDVLAMTETLSKWMSCTSDLEALEKELSDPPIWKRMFSKSIEEEALQVFAASRRAKEQRNELKQWISLTLGQSAWNELLATEGRIRKQRAETIYKQRQKRRKFIEICAWAVVALIGCGVLFGFVMLLKAHTANAQPEHVQCRLVGCDVFQGQRWCVYRGEWNPQETMSFGMSEWFPREYLCDFVPDAPKPPSMRDTLKAIRESQK